MGESPASHSVGMNPLYLFPAVLYSLAVTARWYVAASIAGEERQDCRKNAHARHAEALLDLKIKVGLAAR